MKRARTSAMVFALALGAAVGCTAYPTLKKLPLACNAEAGYELESIETSNPDGTANVWGASDMPDAAPSLCNQELYRVQTCVEPIPDGPRCGNANALVMRATGNNDWGSLVGINNFGLRDASAYEGLAFWARAPGNTTKAFTIALGDTNTSCLGEGDKDGGVCTMQPSNCITYAAADGGTGTGKTDGTGMLLPGTITSAPEPDQCGNTYSVVKVVTGEWAFYTIPFSEFQQTALPNRVPNAVLAQTGPVPGTALLTNELLTLTFRMPKAATMELWIDNLSFYRKATGTGGGDGGVDAPQM